MLWVIGRVGVILHVGRTLDELGRLKETVAVDLEN